MRALVLRREFFLQALSVPVSRGQPGYHRRYGSRSSASVEGGGPLSVAVCGSSPPFPGKRRVLEVCGSSRSWATRSAAASLCAALRPADLKHCSVSPTSTFSREVGRPGQCTPAQFGIFRQVRWFPIASCPLFSPARPSGIKARFLPPVRPPACPCLKGCAGIKPGMTNRNETKQLKPNEHTYENHPYPPRCSLRRRTLHQRVCWGKMRQLLRVLQRRQVRLHQGLLQKVS